MHIYAIAMYKYTFRQTDKIQHITTIYGSLAILRLKHYVHRPKQRISRIRRQQYFTIRINNGDILFANTRLTLPYMLLLSITVHICYLS